MQPTALWGRGRRVAAPAVAVAVVLALAYSGSKDVPHSFRLVRSQHAAYAGYTRVQRDRLFGTVIPIDMGIFDFWRDQIRVGDRYWLQMPPEPFSTFADKRQIARNIAHIYLLPALETQHLDDATVVLSWDADPGLLHRTYTKQERAGVQLIFFSRLAHGG